MLCLQCLELYLTQQGLGKVHSLIDMVIDWVTPIDTCGPLLGLQEQGVVHHFLCIPRASHRDKFKWTLFWGAPREDCCTGHRQQAMFRIMQHLPYDTPSQTAGFLLALFLPSRAQWSTSPMSCCSPLFLCLPHLLLTPWPRLPGL